MNSKFLTTIIVLAISLLVREIKSAPIKWTISSGGNDHYYDIVDSGPITWDNARIAASLLPVPPGYKTGHLVTISSAAENAFLTSTIGSMISSGFRQDGAWFGFTDQAVEGEWRWIDDTPGIWQDNAIFSTPIQTAYTNWEISPKEPNGDSNENWGSMRSNGRWNDYYEPDRLNPQYLV